MSLSLPVIESERIKRGMDKDAFAKMLNVTPRTVTNWQNGSTEMPISKLAQLAKEWNVTTDYLLGLAAWPVKT